MKRKADSEGGAYTKRSNLKAGKPRVYARQGPSMRAPPVPRPGFQRTAGLYGRFNKQGSRPAQAELKYLDTALSFSDDFTFGVENSCLNVIPQDATASGRIGRKVVVKSIQVRGVLQYAPGASTTGSVAVKMAIVLDKQCNGVAATIAEIFTSNLVSTSMINLANSERFVVLKQWHVTVCATAGIQTAFGGFNQWIDWYQKVDIPIEYDATASTGALATVRSNNLLLVAGADTSDGDDDVSFSGTCRLRYSDN